MELCIPATNFQTTIIIVGSLQGPAPLGPMARISKNQSTPRPSPVKCRWRMLVDGVQEMNGPVAGIFCGTAL